MYDQAGAKNPTPVPQSMSRINNDTESVKRMVERVEHITGRIIGHARALGYFEPPKDASNGVSPVITTLSDALQALDRAIDHASGSLNVFD